MHICYFMMSRRYLDWGIALFFCSAEQIPNSPLGRFNKVVLYGTSVTTAPSLVKSEQNGFYVSLIISPFCHKLSSNNVIFLV